MSGEVPAASSTNDRLSFVAAGVHVPDSPIRRAADTARLMGFPTREALAKVRRTGRISIECSCWKGAAVGSLGVTTWLPGSRLL